MADPANAPAPANETTAPAGAAPAAAPAGGNAIPIIAADFTLITPDKKRKVQFGLSKELKGGDIIWTINFALFERDDITKPFDTDPMVRLDVTVDTTLNDKVEAATKGLKPEQEAQATGPASDAVKAAKTNPHLKHLANHEVQKSVE
jgi:hypothetical protein